MLFTEAEHLRWRTRAARPKSGFHCYRSGCVGRGKLEPPRLGAEVPLAPALSQSTAAERVCLEECERSMIPVDERKERNERRWGWGTCRSTGTVEEVQKVGLHEHSSRGRGDGSIFPSESASNLGSSQHNLRCKPVRPRREQ